MTENMDTDSYYIQSFNKYKNYRGLTTFDCGDPVINHYVRNNLRKQGKRHFSTIKLLTCSDDVLLGFYSSSLFQLNQLEHSAALFTSSSPPRIRVFKIAMLAVIKTFKGEGWGQQLMREAFIQAISIWDYDQNLDGVYVDAAPDTVGFYEKKFGFIKLEKQPPSENGSTALFIPMQVVNDARL